MTSGQELSTVVSRVDEPLGVAGAGALLGLGIYGVVDAVVFGVSDAQRISYALVWGAVVLSVVIAMPRSRLVIRAWRFLALWLFVVAVLLIPSVWHPPFYPGYIAGDAASLMLPALMLMLGLAVPALFGPVAVAGLCFALTAGMVLAPLAGASGARFEAPSSFLIAVSIWLIARGRAVPLRILGAALAGLALAIALASGQRTSVMVWLALLACAAYLYFGARWTVVAGILAVMIVLGPARGAVTSAIKSSLQSTRFSTVVEGESDRSLLNRFQEGIDVVATLRTTGTPATWVIGFGHGATFKPRYSFPARNVTAEGRVHNIHLGPLLLLFRYGLLGLLLALLVATKAAAVIVRAGGRRPQSAGPLETLYAMAVIAFLVEGLMFNVLVDPLFSYALAGLLFHGVGWGATSGGEGAEA